MVTSALCVSARSVSYLSRIALFAVFLGGCAGEPEVSVSTRVGEIAESAAPLEALSEEIGAYRRWLGAMPALALADDDIADEPRSRRGKSSKKKRGTKQAKRAPLPPPRPPENAVEFGAAIKVMRKGPVADLAIPANNLALAGAELWPEIKERLLAPRKGRKKDYRALLDRIGGDVPNRYGHFERSWKRAHGYDVRLSEDWFRDLLELAPSRIGRSFHSIYRDCVLESALLQAASKIAADTPKLADEVVATLLDAAYIHEGTFRDEVGRAIRRVGEPALPELIRRSLRPPIKRKDDRFSDPYRKAEYAEYQLDRLDRLQPRKAVAGVIETPHLLAAVLSAYGERRFPDAAEVLLDFVDAGLPRVRRAARDAFLAYVRGPAPASERKILRLLGGKTSSAKAGQTYRDAAAVAIRERLEEEASLLVEEPCKMVLPEGGRDEICARQPERHTHALLAFIDSRRAQEEETAVVAALDREVLSETIAALDRLLVVNPDRMADARVIDAYRRGAEAALADGQHRRAGQLLRKTAMLLTDRDPEGKRSLTIQALLAEAESDNLPPAGRAMLLTTAEALAPEDPATLSAIAEIRRQRLRPPSPSPLRLGGGLALLGALLLMLSVAGSRTGPWLNRPPQSV